MTQTHPSPVPLAACAIGLATMFAAWSASVFLGSWLGFADRLVYDSLSHRPRDAWFQGSLAGSCSVQGDVLFLMKLSD